MNYHFKELNIISNFDIFNVKFIQFYTDFFELYYEKITNFINFMFIYQNKMKYYLKQLQIHIIEG